MFCYLSENMISFGCVSCVCISVSDWSTTHIHVSLYNLQWFESAGYYMKKTS